MDGCVQIKDRWEYLKRVKKSIGMSAATGVIF